MTNHLEDAQEDAAVDMTPMIDVVFLLIIFFLCIDFKVLEAKLPAYLPTDRGSHEIAAEPIEQLSIKIVCDDFGTPVVRNRAARRSERTVDAATERKLAVRLDGHAIHWEVGPKRFDDMAKMRAELEKIAVDPNRRVVDRKNPGEMKLIEVVIEPAARTTYGDVATTVDLVADAGFEEIHFGGVIAAEEPEGK